MARRVTRSMARRNLQDEMERSTQASPSHEEPAATHGYPEQPPQVAPRAPAASGQVAPPSQPAHYSGAFQPVAPRSQAAPSAVENTSSPAQQGESAHTSLVRPSLAPLHNPVVNNIPQPGDDAEFDKFIKETKAIPEDQWPTSAHSIWIPDINKDTCLGTSLIRRHGGERFKGVNGYSVYMPSLYAFFGTGRFFVNVDNCKVYANFDEIALPLMTLARKVPFANHAELRLVLQQEGAEVRARLQTHRGQVEADRQYAMRLQARENRDNHDVVPMEEEVMEENIPVPETAGRGHSPVRPGTSTNSTKRKAMVDLTNIAPRHSTPSRNNVPPPEQTFGREQTAEPSRNHPVLNSGIDDELLNNSGISPIPEDEPAEPEVVPPTPPRPPSVVPVAPNPTGTSRLLSTPRTGKPAGHENSPTHHTRSLTSTPRQGKAASNTPQQKTPQSNRGVPKRPSLHSTPRQGSGRTPAQPVVSTGTGTGPSTLTMPPKPTRTVAPDILQNPLPKRPRTEPPVSTQPAAPLNPIQTVQDRIAADYGFPLAEIRTIPNKEGVFSKPERSDLCKFRVSVVGSLFQQKEHGDACLRDYPEEKQYIQAAYLKAQKLSYDLLDNIETAFKKDNALRKHLSYPQLPTPTFEPGQKQMETGNMNELCRIAQEEHQDVMAHTNRTYNYVREANPVEYQEQQALQEGMRPVFESHPDSQPTEPTSAPFDEFVAQYTQSQRAGSQPPNTIQTVAEIHEEPRTGRTDTGSAYTVTITNQATHGKAARTQQTQSKGTTSSKATAKAQPKGRNAKKQSKDNAGATSQGNGGQGPQPEPTCDICHSTEHRTDQCPHKKETVCAKCKQAGHTKRNCPLRCAHCGKRSHLEDTCWNKKRDEEEAEKRRKQAAAEKEAKDAAERAHHQAQYKKNAAARQEQRKQEEMKRAAEDRALREEYQALQEEIQRLRQQVSQEKKECEDWQRKKQTAAAEAAYEKQAARNRMNTVPQATAPVAPPQPPVNTRLQQLAMQGQTVDYTGYNGQSTTAREAPSPVEAVRESPPPLVTSQYQRAGSHLGSAVPESRPVSAVPSTHSSAPPPYNNQEGPAVIPPTVNTNVPPPPISNIGYHHVQYQEPKLPGNQLYLPAAPMLSNTPSEASSDLTNQIAQLLIAERKGFEHAAIKAIPCYDGSVKKDCLQWVTRMRGACRRNKLPLRENLLTKSYGALHNHIDAQKDMDDNECIKDIILHFSDLGNAINATSCLHLLHQREMSVSAFNYQYSQIFELINNIQPIECKLPQAMYAYSNALNQNILTWLTRQMLNKDEKKRPRNLQECMDKAAEFALTNSTKNPGESAKILATDYAPQQEIAAIGYQGQYNHRNGQGNQQQSYRSYQGKGNQQNNYHQNNKYQAGKSGGNTGEQNKEKSNQFIKDVHPETSTVDPTVFFKKAVPVWQDAVVSQVTKNLITFGYMNPTSKCPPWVIAFADKLKDNKDQAVKDAQKHLQASIADLTDTQVNEILALPPSLDPTVLDGVTEEVRQEA